MVLIPIRNRTLASRSVLLLCTFLNVLAVSAHRWYNWQFDLTCESTSMFVPQDEADLAKFVAEQYEKKSMLKVVGNGHGFGNLTTCVDKSTTDRESYVISLTNLKDFRVNNDSTVTFSAGWDLVDLIPELQKHNLSVINLGTERVQNYIGAVSTGTHGTGQNLGNLASQVVGLRVMDSRGNITVIDRNSDELKAFRMTLGVLGLITEVTVQTEPIEYLKRTTKVISSNGNVTQMYADIYEYYQKYDRMMVWGPHMDWNSNTSSWDMESDMTITYWEDTNITGINNCSTNYCANGCGNCVRDYVCYDQAPGAISTPPAGVCNRFFYTEIEHFFPVEDFVEAAANYTNYQLSQTSQMTRYNNHQMIYELRFVKGDDTWMSPVNTYNLGKNNSGVFAVIEIDWYMTYNDFDTLWFYQTLAEDFIPRFGKEYNVRPHWGKMSWFDETYAEFIYPKLEQFKAIQERMDPQCQFVNEFLIDHLGIERCRNIFQQ